MIEEDPPASLRWRPPTYLLVAAGVVLVLLSVAFRTPVPLFAALPLLIAPVAAAFAFPMDVARVDLAWRASGLGSDLRIEGSVAGEMRGIENDVFLEFQRPGGIGQAAPPQYLRSPKEVRFRLRWTLPEPSISLLPPPTIVWRDPTGVVERAFGGTRPELPVERFPPEIHRLGSVRLDRTRALPGETRSRRIGASGEFFGIREALPTDPPRRINWMASARRGRWLANEYQLDRTGDVLLLLDARPTPLGETVDDRLLGISRAGLYGIAESFLREKARVGFASYGEFVDAVPLSSGRAHRIRVQRAILRTRRSPVAGPAERCAIALRRFFPPGVTTLVLSSCIGDSTFDLAPYLRRRGFPVVVLSPSPLPIHQQASPLPSGDEELAERLEKLERQERLAKVWVHAPVIDWDDYWSLAGLVRFLRQPARRRVS